MRKLLTIVGERIRYLRKNRGLTQEQLGEKVDLPQSYIGGIERGEKNISLNTLERIIIALEVDANDVFTKKQKDMGKEVFFDKISLLLENRTLTEIKIIHTLVTDVLKAFDEKI
ncbi:hypothetical protein A9P44_03525 [Paenibacillus polymyxa]|nr:helix-turn-helix transcriptional regulator [Paenibacillus polymyxa]OBA06002.1 hypothetical protein A9P44_03525 [Paenibacillus polymyxa]